VDHQVVPVGEITCRAIQEGAHERIVIGGIALGANCGRWPLAPRCVKIDYHPVPGEWSRMPTLFSTASSARSSALIKELRPLALSERRGTWFTTWPTSPSAEV
jgi:hypothetical protein